MLRSGSGDVLDGLDLLPFVNSAEMNLDGEFSDYGESNRGVPKGNGFPGAGGLTIPPPRITPDTRKAAPLRISGR
jgi:hypothetical protein